MRFVAAGQTGMTIYVVLRKFTEAGALGDYWNNVTQTWEVNPSIANRKVTLSEDGTTGVFTGGTGTLDVTYTGWVVVYVHNGADDTVLSADEVYVVNGAEQRIATGYDLLSLPLAIRSELFTNPVPASNMRGTDNAFLAANWVAPANATISAINSTVGTINTEVLNAKAEALAAKSAAQSADGKLPADTTAKLANLDAAITTRSSHSAADVRTHINSNGGVTASNMRGTDNAFLAANWVAPANADITASKNAALAAQTAAEGVRTDYTTARAVKLDYLVGTVATAADVSGISNVVKSKIVGVNEVQKPASGSRTVRLYLYVYGDDLTLNDPDGQVVTWTAVNESGVVRTGNLTGATRTAVGKYQVDYSVASTHADELITVFASYTENSIATQDLTQFSVVAIAAGGGFTSTDRSKLEAMHGKLPSRAFLAGTDAADGDLSLDNMDGSRTPFHADQTAVINAARDAVIARGDIAWVTATGFLATGDSRLNYLDAAISTRATASVQTTMNNAVANIDSDIVALQAHGDANWSTATGFLATGDARLNNLDATISSRSTFNHATNTVIVPASVALEATSQAIKAKTGNLPADPAGVTNVPTAGQIATQVDATLTGVHGGGSWSASDATLAKQNEILVAVGSIGGTSSTSTIQVASHRTWQLSSGSETGIAPQVVTVASGDTMTLAMDFGQWLNPATAIVTVASVVDNLALLTIANAKVDQSKRRAHFDITAGLVAGKIHKIKVTVTTSDGQTVSGTGQLEVI